MGVSLPLEVGEGDGDGDELVVVPVKLAAATSIRRSRYGALAVLNAKKPDMNSESSFRQGLPRSRRSWEELHIGDIQNEARATLPDVPLTSTYHLPFHERMQGCL